MLCQARTVVPCMEACLCSVLPVDEAAAAVFFEKTNVHPGETKRINEYFRIYTNQENSGSGKTVIFVVKLHKRGRVQHPQIYKAYEYFYSEMYIYA